MLAYGADPTVKDLDNLTARSEAHRTNNPGILEILDAGPALRTQFL